MSVRSRSLRGKPFIKGVQNGFAKVHSAYNHTVRTTIVAATSTATAARTFKTKTTTTTSLNVLYNETKRKIYSREVALPDISDDVFVNNEVSLRRIHSFGFDYDYTFASYTREAHKLVYDIAKDNLIKAMNYPKQLMGYAFDDFPIIRGLHFDTENGFLMKIDSRSRIQMGTVYRGFEKVEDEEVINEYGGSLLDVDLISSGSKRSRIFQQTDLFSVALLSLLTNIAEHFRKNNVPFNPAYIFQDAQNAVRSAYRSGRITEAISNDLDQYCAPKDKNLEIYLNRLVNNGKKLFIVTNSSFNFVDKGMRHLFGKDWRDLFDVIVVDARKPRFFSSSSTRTRQQKLPFRNVNCENGTYLWSGVKKFQKHGVYGQGNIDLFNTYTGCERSTVIYWGDHVYNNLLGPQLRIGWRTGALVPELRTEIEICSSEKYVRDMQWLVELEKLITRLQAGGKCTGEGREGGNFETASGGILLLEWRNERKSLRRNLKEMFNPSFGSMFRANENPSSFSKRVTHYTDLYTSNVANMLKYSDHFHFLPGRNLLPHERF